MPLATEPRSRPKQPKKPKRPAVRNLFKNGGLWWTRVYPPGEGKPKKRSTGTDDPKLAAEIVGMLATLRKQREQWDLLHTARDGRVKLPTLYDAFIHSRLDALRLSLDDADLEPEVGKWIESMQSRVRSDELAPKTVEVYAAQVRSLIPEGAPFLRSALTVERVEDWLSDLDVSTSTRRRYFDALRAFVKWARRRKVLTANPLADAEPPRNGDPRDTFWPFATVLRVLDAMPAGEARDCMTLIFGTGMESGAALAAIGGDVNAADRSVWARGTKSGYRSRPCFVASWAWARLEPRFKRTFGIARLFPALDADALRESFQAAQVALELCPKAPTRGEWHSVHDARHTYCYVRTLGEDGDPPKDERFLADQLGHVDTTMVSRIYNKFRLAERKRAQDTHERQHAALQAVEAR